MPFPYAQHRVSKLLRPKAQAVQLRLSRTQEAAVDYLRLPLAALLFGGCGIRFFARVRF